MEKNKLSKKEIEERKKLEKDPNIQRLLGYLKQGESNVKIAQKADIPWEYKIIFRKVKKCINLGLITEKQIQKARDKAECKRLKEDPEIQKIIKYKMEGLNYKQISEQSDIPWSKTKIAKEIKRCIQLGLIKEEKIQEKEEKWERKKLEKDQEIQKMLAYIKQGLSHTEISKKSDISWTRQVIDNKVKKCIQFGLITQEEIQQAKDDKERRELEASKDVQAMLKYIRMGLSNQEISKKSDIPWGEKNIYKKKIKCIELGLITQKEIQNIEEKKEKEELQKDPNFQKILEYILQGLTCKAISRQVDSPYKDGKAIQKQIEKGIKFGLITQEEIQKARDKKERKELEENSEVQRILEYVRQGLSDEEISKKTDISWVRSTISKKMEKCIKLGILTEEKREQAKKQRKKGMLSQLRKDIETEIKFDKTVSLKKKEIIRQYVNTTYKVYAEEKMPKEEMIFLRKSLQKIEVTDEDIIKFAKKGTENGEYEQALEVVRNRHQMQRKTTSKKKEAVLSKWENALKKACKVQQAIQLIKRGNTITEVICEITGLSKDEVNILKIKLIGKPVKFLNVLQREKIVELLLQDKNERIIQQRYGISDFEIEDMKEQAMYKRIKQEKRDVQAQIKQDSTIRIEVLYTKLGKNPEEIAKELKKEPEEVEDDIKKALTVGLIKENQLQGLELLDTKIFESKELAG